MKIEMKDKRYVYIVVAISTLLIFVFGSTYAYFSIIYDKSAIRPSKVKANVQEIAKPSLVTNIEKLKINLDSNLMSEDLVGTVYYATESGTPVTTATLGSGRYILATASIESGSVIYDCSYTYNISASVTKPINDGSDEDVKIKFKNPSGEEVTYSLKEVLDGVEYNSKIKELKMGENQTILVEAYVENATKKQDDLVGNIFTFKIEMTPSEEGFSCKESSQNFDLVEEANGKAIASFMVANKSKIDGLWSSGLEGDGLRYVGTGPNMCAYNGGSYETTSIKDITECPKLYNYVRTTVSSGSTSLYTYQTSCPSDTSYYTYECTEYSGTLTNEVINNYICFGTTDKDECVNNPSKYMYRIIGVFPDEEGGQHLKLISTKQLGTYNRHETNSDINWGDTTLFQNLNGEYFLTNSNFEYLQNLTWLDKIENWKWTAVKTKTKSDNGPDYFKTFNPTEIYLHEMNRNSKTSEVGEWTYPVDKIGLMYASDYALSLGKEAVSLMSNLDNYAAKLKTGWMHYSNNDSSISNGEWTIAYFGQSTIMSNVYTYNQWFIREDGLIDYYMNSMSVRPVFYLASNVTFNSGIGTVDNPYIIR